MAGWKIDTDAGPAECIYVVLRLCPFCSLLPKIFRITIGLKDKADTHTQSKFLYYFIHPKLLTILSTAMLYSVKHTYRIVLHLKRLIFSWKPII